MSNNIKKKYKNTTKNQIKLMQIFLDFSENMNEKKLKKYLNDEILDY